MKLVFGNKIKMTLSVFVIGQIYAGDSDKSNDMIGLSKSTLNADKRSVKVTPTPISDNGHYMGQNVFANTSANENILESLNTPKKSIKNAIRLKAKRKNSSTEVINNKFSDDICIKKIVTCVLEGVREFVNKKIMEEEDYKIDTAMKLTPVNYDSIIVDNNFIHKNVDDIFSSDTSNKQQTSETKPNVVLIEKLMKDKKKWIMWYLGIEFIEYLKYFSGESNTKELIGMKRMRDCKKEMASGDDNYFNQLIDVARKFENIINKKNQSQKKSEVYNSSKDIILESTGNINRKTEDNGGNINLQISGQYNQKNYKDYLIIPKFKNPKQWYNFLNIDNKGITVSKNGRLITMVSTGMNTVRATTSDDEEDDNEETNNLPFNDINLSTYRNISDKNNISAIHQIHIPITRESDISKIIDQKMISSSLKKKEISIEYSGGKRIRKYSSDNCFCKIKRYTLITALKFVNEKIKESYGKDYNDELQLMFPNKSHFIKIKNNGILKKTLSEILSQSVEGINSIGAYHNGEIIERLNKDNKEGVLVLLNEEFIKFVIYFIGDSTDKQFNGMGQLSYINQIHNKDENYINRLINVTRKICNKQKKRNK